MPNSFRPTFVPVGSGFINKNKVPYGINPLQHHTFVCFLVAETRLKSLLVLRRLDWKALPLPLYIRVIKSLNKCRFGCRNKLFVPFPSHFWNGNLGNLVLHLFVLFHCKITMFLFLVPFFAFGFRDDDILFLIPFLLYQTLIL